MLRADQVAITLLLTGQSLSLFPSIASFFMLFYHVRFTYFHFLLTDKIKYLISLFLQLNQNILSVQEGKKSDNLRNFNKEIKIPHTQ